MGATLFASLLHTLNSSNIAEIAKTVNEPRQTAAAGLEASVASVLSAVTSKAEDPGALRRMLNTVPDDYREVSWSSLASSLSSPASSWTAGARRVLSELLGSNLGAVTSAIATESGVSEGCATTLLMITAPVVIRFLNRRVRDEGLSMRDLGTRLRSESGTIRNAVPPGVSDLLLPRGDSAVIAQSVQHRSDSAAWVSVLGFTALAVVGLWLWNHHRVPMMAVRASMSGVANRAAAPSSPISVYVLRALPNGVALKVPQDGVESRLLGVIDGNGSASQTPWIECDRLNFDPGSSILHPDSAEQIDDLAAILTAYPNVKLTLSGFTDSMGSAEQSLEISRARAENVKRQLVSRGISPDRLQAQGFGEMSAPADNSTSAGRARNRRVSLQVTQR